MSRNFTRKVINGFWWNFWRNGEWPNEQSIRFRWRSGLRSGSRTFFFIYYSERQPRINRVANIVIQKYGTALSLPFFISLPFPSLLPSLPFPLPSFPSLSPSPSPYLPFPLYPFPHRFIVLQFPPWGHYHCILNPARGPGRALYAPSAGPGWARPPSAFWCILRWK